MERAKLNAEFITVATISAALVIGTLSWVFVSFPPGALLGWKGWFLRSLTATGTYFLLIKIAITIYFKFIWKIVHQSVYIGGSWRYTFNHSYDSSINNCTEPDKYGGARIVHTPENI